jgi:hypothetical protein
MVPGDGACVAHEPEGVGGADAWPAQTNPPMTGPADEDGVLPDADDDLARNVGS